MPATRTETRSYQTSLYVFSLARLIRTRVDTDNQHFKLHVSISMQDNVALRTLVICAL